MWAVVSGFVDLNDNNHVYRVGDKYPRPGVRVNKARAMELAGENNGLKRKLIEEVKRQRKRNAD